ncbi:MAG: pyrimidine 5'-nucleotidase [Deferrisomatales bacterium]|nr:pyrimidine 5'-nucleotidase [Deferrisomatales bacterium]
MTRTWILDLDNTLYPRTSGLFAEVDRRIDAYMGEVLGIAVEAIPELRRRYRAVYGVTLGGLLAHHGVFPDHYLSFVHDVPLAEYLAPDPVLAEVLGRLPGRKVVFTNGSESHARAVLGLLGVEAAVEAVFDIAFMGYVPKPDPRGYRRLLEALDTEAAACWMVDDLVENLDTGRSLGMTTVLVGPEPSPPHLHLASARELGTLGHLDVSPA